jgi:hypothetical protein
MVADLAPDTMPFVDNLLRCLKMDKRFKEDLYKMVAPFNCLCALDPRCDTLTVQYSTLCGPVPVVSTVQYTSRVINSLTLTVVSRFADLYFTEAQCQDVIDKMATAPMYDAHLFVDVAPVATAEPGQVQQIPTSARR